MSKKVDDLLDQMTLAEQVSLLAGGFAEARALLAEVSFACALFFLSLFFFCTYCK